MMRFVKFLQKRPTDKTIRTIRIVFSVVLMFSAYYSLIYTWNREIQDSLFGQVLGENWKMIVSYSIVGLWVFPLFMWITNMCLLKPKFIRIMQIILSIVIFYAASIIKSSPDLWVDTILFIIAFLPLLWWISWKLITKSCLRYWEKVIKIRV